MSYGFHVHPKFRIAGAVDAQIGKPSSNRGTLKCNAGYKDNIGVEPIDDDLSVLQPGDLRRVLDSNIGSVGLDILISCAPCTGFSRTLPANHLVDDPRNLLIRRSVLFVEEFRPSIFLMENARELIVGNFSHHYEYLRDELTRLGYRVFGKVHLLTRFGLPQRRERSVIIAVHGDLELRTHYTCLLPSCM